MQRPWIMQNPPGIRSISPWKFQILLKILILQNSTTLRSKPQIIKIVIPDTWLFNPVLLDVKNKLTMKRFSHKKLPYRRIFRSYQKPRTFGKKVILTEAKMHMRDFLDKLHSHPTKNWSLESCCFILVPFYCKEKKTLLSTTGKCFYLLLTKKQRHMVKQRIKLRWEISLF